jgi:hypothetical protein
MFLAQTYLNYNLDTKGSHIAGMIGPYHHTQHFCLDVVSLSFCPELALNPDPPYTCLSSSWDYSL